LALSAALAEAAAAQPFAVQASTPAARGAWEPQAASAPSSREIAPSRTPLAALDKRVTLNIRDMPLVQILNMVSRQSQANFVIPKELQDRCFSVFVEKVTVREALRAILETQDLSYERIGASDTFVVKEIRKTRQRLITRIFPLKFTQLIGGDSGGKAGAASAFNIITEAEGAKGAGGAAVGGGGASTADLSAVVKSMLSEFGQLQIYPQTNSLIVSDLPEKFPAIEDVIEALDTPIPQISIQADILETNLSTARKLGLEYGGADGAMTSLQPANQSVMFPFGSNVDLPVAYGLLSVSQFTLVLRAIESSGDGQYLSRPRLLTLNNKPAEINITADTAVGIQSASLIAQSGLLATTAERKTTGISLRVTPQVNSGGLITLLIEPNVTRPQTSDFFPDKFVDAQTSAIKTSVRVQDGETLLIGGLLSDQKVKTVRRVPFLWRIPLLGHLFTAVKTDVVKRELLIFITPRIVKG
jgi:type II secretory pathway component GspD/PulD (secretin)